MFEPMYDLDPNDDPRSNGYCLRHGNYNGRNMSCPYCKVAKDYTDTILKARELHQQYPCEIITALEPGEEAAKRREIENAKN